MKKVLIVEDSDSIRSAYKYLLKRKGVVDYAMASDPIEARRVLASGFKPDVIISDWDMPRMNGGELCETLRLEGNETPFYIVSGDVRDHAAVGANGSFLKPLTVEDLETILGKT